MERRLFKDAPEKALPQAVCDDLVDVIMVQVGEGGRERGGRIASVFILCGGGGRDRGHCPSIGRIDLDEGATESPTPLPSSPPSSPPQGPRTKDLSPFVVDMLCNAPTSVLIWPPEAENTALGQVLV